MKLELDIYIAKRDIDAETARRIIEVMLKQALARIQYIELESVSIKG